MLGAAARGARPAARGLSLHVRCSHRSINRGHSGRPPGAPGAAHLAAHPCHLRGAEPPLRGVSRLSQPGPTPSSKATDPQSSVPFAPKALSRAPSGYSLAGPKAGVQDEEHSLLRCGDYFLSARWSPHLLHLPDQLCRHAGGEGTGARLKLLSTTLAPHSLAACRHRLRGTL